MFWYVYVLESIHQPDKLYVGFTENLQKRLTGHNRKYIFSTKLYAPWPVIHYQAYNNIEDAKRREKYLKTNQGSRLLRRMLKEYLYSKRKK